MKLDIGSSQSLPGLIKDLQPPPIPPPRPVPKNKNITIDKPKFSDRDNGKTMIMTEQDLSDLMTLPLQAGAPTTLHVQGRWEIDVGKTGIQLSLYDTIAEKTFFQYEYYSGRANYSRGAYFNYRLNLLVPSYIPASTYEVKIHIIDWIRPQDKYAIITTTMTVDDLPE